MSVRCALPGARGCASFVVDAATSGRTSTTLEGTSMKWAWVVVGVLAAVVLAVVGIGYVLPTDHLATRAVQLEVPPSEVVAAITDVGAYPTWRKDVDSVEVLPPVEGRPSWRERSGGD